LLAALVLVAVSNLVPPFYLIDLDGLRTGAILALGLLVLLVVGVVDLRSGGRDLSVLGRLCEPYTLALFFFFLVMCLGLLWTPDLPYGLHKTRGFLTFSVVPVALIGLLGPLGRRDVKLSVAVILASALAATLILLVDPQDHAQWAFRKTVHPEIHPNNVARNIGLALPIILGWLLVLPRVRIPSMLSAIGALVLVVLAVFLTASRGPILAGAFGAVGVLALGLPGRRVGRRLVRLGVSAVVLTGVGGYVVVTQLRGGDVFERVLFYTATLGQNPSDVSRLSRYEVAIRGFLDSGMLGVGPGGFTALWTGPAPGGIFTGRDYPHNLILEAAVETGLFGVLLLAFIFWRIGVRLMRWRLLADPDEGVPLMLLAGLWLYSTFNAFVSGDLATNHFFWVTGGLLWHGLDGHLRAVHVDASDGESAHGPRGDQNPQPTN
jgi:O-antigen ligase